MWQVLRSWLKPGPVIIWARPDSLTAANKPAPFIRPAFRQANHNVFHIIYNGSFMGMLLSSFYPKRCFLLTWLTCNKNKITLKAFNVIAAERSHYVRPRGGQALQGTEGQRDIQQFFLSVSLSPEPNSSFWINVFSVFKNTEKHTADHCGFLSDIERK